MRKLFLMLAAGIVMPLAVLGQQTLTLHDGTETSIEVVVNTRAMSKGTHSYCQSKYPAGELQQMTGKTLSKMQFYSTSSNTTFAGPLEVIVAEVSDSAYTNSRTLPRPYCLLYNDTLRTDSNGVLEIPFNSYIYHGGTLLINFAVPFMAGWASFYGDSTNYNSSITTDQSSNYCVPFLPKVTFTYSDQTGCESVQYLSATDTTITQTTGPCISWDASPLQSLWHAVYTVDGGATYDTATVTVPYWTVGGLRHSTEYTMSGWIFGECEEGWTEGVDFTIDFATSCGVREEPVFLEDFEVDNFPQQCWVKGKLGSDINANTFSRSYNPVTTGKVHSGTHSCKIAKPTSSTIKDSSYYLSTYLLPIDKADKYEVSLWVYRDSSTTSKERYNGEGVDIWVVPNNTDTAGGVKLGHVNSFRHLAPYEATSGMYEYHFPIPVAGEYSVMVVAVRKGSNHIFFDDLRIRQRIFEVYDSICSGDAYTGYGLENIVLTKDTVFDVPGVSAEGYDSITRVSVTLRQTEFADTVTICSNEMLDGEFYEPGEYDKDLQYVAATSCDSIVHKHIIVNEAFEFDETMTDVEAAFEWHGQEITESGVYTDTYATATGCDSIYRLNITFKAGVENAGAMRVTIVPNPAKAGAAAMIHGDFENVRMVELLNSQGQVTDSFVPADMPIEVKGIETAGVYFVRIITDGEAIMEKLIIE